MAGWSQAECGEIEAAIAERLDGMLEPGERVAVSGTSDEKQVEARLELAGSQSGLRLVLQARIELGRARVDAQSAGYVALDALDSILLDWLDSGRSQRFSGVWEEREFEQTPISILAERTFPDLEAQADALLARSDPERQ